MARHGLYRLFVGQFAMKSSPPASATGSSTLRLEKPSEDVVASMGTHDTASVAAFVADADLGDPGELLEAWLLELAASDAAAVSVTLDDLWLEREPQNRPGTTDSQHPNWRLRHLRPLTSLLEDGELSWPLSSSELIALEGEKTNDPLQCHGHCPADLRYLDGPDALAKGATLGGGRSAASSGYLEISAF